MLLGDRRIGMKEKRIMVLISSFIISVFVFSQTPNQADWENANRKVLRLAATSFPQLPDSVKNYLIQNGFEIPQAASLKEPHNVIKGQFIRPGQFDWSILVSKNFHSTILIFPNSSTDGVIQLAQNEDRNFLQVLSPGIIGFGRLINPANREYILNHYKEYGGSKPPAIDHEGINDIFVGKSSVVLYFYNGKWLTLTGAD